MRTIAMNVPKPPVLFVLRHEILIHPVGCSN